MNFIGKIVRTRGNKGEVVIETSPFFLLEQFKSGQIFTLKSPKTHTEKTLEWVREIGGRTILKFKEIDTIPLAFKIIGYSILSKEISAQAPPGKNLIGFRVREMDDTEWGTVRGISRSKFQDCLEIQDQNSTRLIPYIDAFIHQIDWDNKLIIINPPSGLRDINP